MFVADHGIADLAVRHPPDLTSADKVEEGPDIATRDTETAHMRDIEKTARSSHLIVFLDNRAVMKRHVPAREINQLGSPIHVELVEGGVGEGYGGGRHTAEGNARRLLPPILSIDETPGTARIEGDGNGHYYGIRPRSPCHSSRQQKRPNQSDARQVASFLWTALASPCAESHASDLMSYTTRQGRHEMSTHNSTTSKPGFLARVFGGGEVIEPDQKAIIIAVLLGVLVGVLT